MSKGTVLIVDDDADILDLVQEALEEEGYAVAVSRDSTALRHVHEQQVDLILLDLTVMGVDGRATADWLRADPATAHIPLIGFSARNDGALLAAQMHLDYLLPKPFDLDHLVALVSQWIAEGHRWRDTAAPGWGYAPAASQQGTGEHPAPRQGQHTR